MSKQVFESEFIGEVGVDTGHIELGDVGEVQLALPTRLGDGVYSVTEIKVNGQVRGYWLNVDALEEWIVTGIEGSGYAVAAGEEGGSQDRYGVSQ